ncbi:hypothetical protein M5K25_018682 [Dendrobium thyrsiflorum]|uniref:Gluconokinase n=1 Tax=Dendrobium thyrsiflorum TaxID=117978 RepID=A0ABD0UJA8_DENTH
MPHCLNIGCLRIQSCIGALCSLFGQISEAAAMARAIVIMGVSGSGKTSVAKMLSESFHCSFLEADDFHSHSNKEKMLKGIPLCDEDRFPWLEALRDAIRKKFVDGETVVLACSALQKRYRDIIRSADPDYKAGEYSSCKVKFVCLVAPVGTIAERINKRSEEGNHFMPVSLLQSQMDLLQIFEYERIPQIDSTMNLQLILDQILTLFKDI